MGADHRFHNLADARSWALHAEVAARLTADPGLIERARRRVRAWTAQPTEHPYALAWHELLSRSVEELQEALTNPGEPMITLRQSSPFAGALPPKVRSQILKRKELRPREVG